MKNEEEQRYREAGVEDLEDMSRLSDLRINGTDAAEIAELDFEPTSIDFLERVGRKNLGHTIVGALRLYNEAGVGENQEAVLKLIGPDVEVKEEVINQWVELKKLNEHPRLSPDYAIFLAQHGLEGDAEAMLEFRLGHEDPRYIARIIACELEGIEYHMDFGENFEAEYQHHQIAAEELRKRHAPQIPARFISLLGRYDFADSDQIKEQYEKDLDEAVKVEGEEKSNQMWNVIVQEYSTKEKQLVDAFYLLRDEGEEAFKQRYMSHAEVKMGHNLIADELGISRSVQCEEDKQTSKTRYKVLGKFDCGGIETRTAMLAEYEITREQLRTPEKSKTIGGE